MPAAAVVAVVAAVVGSAAEVGMSVVVVAAAQERQLTGKGDRQQLERAARRLQLFLIELLSFISKQLLTLIFQLVGKYNKTWRAVRMRS